MINILLVSTNSNVSEVLEGLLSGPDICLSKYGDKPPSDLFNFQAVMIVEPYVIGEVEYLSIFSVWKRYLADKAQRTKLLVLGFKKLEHPNYVNLLQLSSKYDWESKIDRAPSVGEDWPDGSGLRHAPDVLEKLSLFFTGHNFESIIDCITHVRATLNNANISLYGSETLNVGQKDIKDFDEIWKTILVPGRPKLREFYSRWRNYINYFDAMPFNDQLEKIGARNFVEQLNQLFSGRPNLGNNERIKKEKLYRELSAFRKVGDLTEVLQNLNKKYINPESIAEVLLIDDDSHFHKTLPHLFTGFDFHHAYDAKDAKDFLKVRRFDLILLDLQLSGKSGHPLEGVDLIPELKQFHPETPLVVVSTHTKPSIIQRTMSNGADFYLTKSSLDIEKWINIFLKLKGKQRFSFEQVIDFNAPNEPVSAPAILIVEDEKKWFEQLKTLSNDYRYEWAYTIQQAGDLLASDRKKYDLLILDLYYRENGVEKNHGLDFLETVKEDFPELPVIVMTQSSHDKDQLEAVGRGVDFYWPKSQFNGPMWLKSIKLLIELKKLKEQLNA